MQHLHQKNYIVQCPECNSERSFILESRATARGQRRRRFECQTCLHRWTSFEQDTNSPYRRSKVEESKKLAKADVVELIESELAVPELAEKYDIAQEMVLRIQRGVLYKDIYEELYPCANRSVLHCVECLHWRRERCGLEFPEGGDTFATDCSAYLASVTQLPITDERQSA
jgi:hypothetical protein